MIWNQIKTILLLGTLSGLLVLLGYTFAGSTGIQIALLFSIIFNLIAYFYGAKLVLRMYKAQPLDQHKYASIYTMVHELSRTMRLPMPKLWLINTPNANAFATGRNPKHASIALTTGIMSLLDEHELRGVLAHELSHVKNRDMLITTLAAIIASAIGMLANMAYRMAFFEAIFGNRNRNRKGGGILGALAIAILMPIAALIIRLAISRSREYLADESGAHYSGDPLALASALEKLEKNRKHAHFSSKNRAHTSTASLFIVNPFWGNGFVQLFSTHPATQKRVQLLQNLYEKMRRGR